MEPTSPGKGFTFNDIKAHHEVIETDDKSAVGVNDNTFQYYIKYFNVI